MNSIDCPLCDSQGGEIIVANELLRIVLADEVGFPGFARVIWNDHIAEMTDLTLADQSYVMRVVLSVETAMRSTLNPDKINLASLGNQVAHVHWHVIARYKNDSHFPDAVWAPARREPAAGPGPMAAAVGNFTDAVRQLSLAR